MAISDLPKSLKIKPHNFCMFKIIPNCILYEFYPVIIILPIKESFKNQVCCVGFLSSILGIFSFCSLFPTELEVTTKAQNVFDQFWLKGIGLSIPTDEDMTLLNERLSRYQK